MAFTTDQLAACKQYMKVDDDADDSLISSLMDAAAEYLDAAGVRDSTSARYTLAIKALTLHYYDHRDDVSAQLAIPQPLRLLINQLKTQSFTDPAPEALDD